MEIRWSEIASKVILSQKQSSSSYMARRVLHPILDCPYMHLLSTLTSNSTKEGAMFGTIAGGRNSMQRILEICQKSEKSIKIRIYTLFQKDGSTPARFIVGGESLEGQLVNFR